MNPDKRLPALFGLILLLSLTGHGEEASQDIEFLRLKARPVDEVIQMNVLAYAKLNKEYFLQMAWRYPYPVDGEQVYKSKVIKGQPFGRDKEFVVESIEENTIEVDGLKRLELVVRIRFLNDRLTLRIRDTARAESGVEREGEFQLKIATLFMINGSEFEVRVNEGQRFELGGREYTVLNIFEDVVFLDPKPVGDEIPDMITVPMPAEDE
jgi:hypothetical protein